MNVWTACAAMWVVVILCIRFVSWVEITTFDFVAQTNEEETVRSWSDSLMIIIGAISEQGKPVYGDVRSLQGSHSGSPGVLSKYYMSSMKGGSQYF